MLTELYWYGTYMYIYPLLFCRVGVRSFALDTLLCSQIVGNIVFYNLWKFQIDSLQIKIRMNFVSLQKFFRFLDQLGLGEIVIWILKQLPMTSRCPMYRRVETPRWPKCQGVETPLCPKNRGVAILDPLIIRIVQLYWFFWIDAHLCFKPPRFQDF